MLVLHIYYLFKEDLVESEFDDEFDEDFDEIIYRNSSRLTSQV